MAARRGVVIDRHGNVVDDEADRPLRDGEALRVPIEFADSKQRTAIADLRRRIPPQRVAIRDAANPYPISDAARQRVVDAYSEFKARVGAGMHRNRATLPGDAVGDGDGAVAYALAKKRLGTPRAKRQRLPAEKHGWRP